MVQNQHTCLSRLITLYSECSTTVDVTWYFVKFSCGRQSWNQCQVLAKRNSNEVWNELMRIDAKPVQYIRLKILQSTVTEFSTPPEK